MRNNKAYLALSATSIIWGTTWVASRLAVQDAPGLQVSYIRQFIAGSVLLSYFFIKGEKLPDLKQFVWLLILSVLMFVFGNGFTTWSVKFIPSGLAALIAALYPLSVVIIDMLFFRQHKNSPLTFVGLIIGFAGVAVVFYENAFHNQPEGYGFGVTLGLLAMLAWSFGTIYIARNKYNINPYYGLGWQMFLSSFMIYLLAIGTHNNIPLADITLRTWSAIAYLVIIGSVITYSAFIYTIRHLPASIASLYAYFNPIVAMIFGSILLNEPFTITLLIGAIITLAGVYIVNYSIKKGE